MSRHGYFNSIYYVGCVRVCVLTRGWDQS